MNDQYYQQQSQYPDVRRVVPQSTLDWNMMMTDTVWGSQEISKQIKDKVRERAKNDQDEFDHEAAWDLLKIYTRDLRLANLNVITGEVFYCQYYIDLAADLVREGMAESFATALSRSATVLELSQSKGGFLRKRQNTLTTESLQGDLEPQKKRLLSFGRQQRS